MAFSFQHTVLTYSISTRFSLFHPCWSLDEDLQFPTATHLPRLESISISPSTTNTTITIHTITVLLIILLPYALVIPFNILHKLLTRGPNPNPNWTATMTSIVICSSTSSQVVILAGAQLETVLNDAYAAIMPTCAYPEHLGLDKCCVPIINFLLIEERTPLRIFDGSELRCKFYPEQYQAGTVLACMLSFP